MAIQIFSQKKDCCGCGACAAVCRCNAITMKSDEEGFIYPVVDEALCVECGLCKKVCSFRTSEKQAVDSVYVATIKNEKEIMKSASGGMFAAAAISILENQGVVFGAALTFEDGHPNPHHIMVDSVDKLWMLQGSKYVQSSIEDTYQQAEECLKKGKTVLFSGTPCQISGLKGYLRKEYENLYTMDLICHGVPSNEFFDGYIQQINKKYHGKVTQYKFRDKTRGWGMNTAIEIEINGKKKTVYKRARVESYFSLFLDCKTYRENCYTCPYAAPERIGDITIGDYWGVEKAHPELMDSSVFQEKKGISCLLVNNEKGNNLFQLMQKNLNFKKSVFEKAAVKNGQLNSPSEKPAEREIIMDIYSSKGYEGVERYFRKKYRKQIIVHTIYNRIPRKLRLKLKSILKG